jgi:uncharacterized flavoprotein (TIGR03862 family)
MTDVAIIGGGPAGLIAAEHLAQAGCTVAVYDRMPSPGRKFLMAGRGGLNLTHSEPFDTFLTRYGELPPQLEAALRAFPPEALRAWALGLGEETFTGSSGRVFPKSFKASPLLRAWLRRLDALGVRVHTRHDWKGFAGDDGLLFATPDGEQRARVKAVLLALGGASWPRLGADGGWTAILAGKSVPVTPLAPSNCGVRLDWSETFRGRFAGTPLKRAGLQVSGRRSMGDLVVTESGLEGGALYALTPELRRALDAGGPAEIAIDLRPDLDHAAVIGRLSQPRRGASLSNFLRKALKLAPVQTGLLREAHGRDLPSAPSEMAGLIKHLALKITGLQGLDRAISTAGGIPFSALNGDFGLKALPGVFAAGEMLDWEAPTGGYLLQASFATGAAAARGLAKKVRP